MTRFDPVGALMIGLLGAGHCLAMCGGIAASLNLAIPPGQRRLAMVHHLAFHLGRIGSYALAGGLVAELMAQALVPFGLQQGLIVLRLLAGVLMILLGLQLARWWQGLTAIERLGQGLWQRLRPLAQRLLPLPTPWHALPYGMLWGWLPCGLVYSSLSWSALAGSFSGGALIMFCFGLGTLPALLTLSGLAEGLRFWLNHGGVRSASGVLLLLYGVHTLYVSLLQL